MKNIIEFSKNVFNLNEKEDIDKIIDSSFSEEIKDLTNTAGDIIKPIRAIISVYNFARRRKFKAFLKSYAENLKKEFSSSGNIERSEELKRYLENENNLNFIYEAIDNAINSKSIYCSSLLGHYTSRILINQVEINYKDLITVEALRNLNDIELEMFVRIYKVANLTRVNKVNEYDQLKAYHYLCEMTVNKLKNLQVLEEDEAGRWDSKTGWGAFISTEIAEDIFEQIEKMGIDEKMLNKK